MPGGNWEPIEGRVIASKIHRVLNGSSGTQTQWEYVVEYQAADGQSQRITLKQASSWVFGMKMINPAEGHRVPLLRNRKSGKVRFDVTDPRINSKAIYRRDKAKADAKFDRARKGD